jgi:hypothetical protein
MRAVTTKRIVFAAMAILLAIAAIAYIQPGMFAYLNIYDEGIIVYGAERVMQGDLPYRDFWTQYSPGQLYVLAGLFSAFGVNIMVERWWDVLIRALLALSMLAVSAKLTSWKLALPVWLLGVLWAQAYGFFGYPIFAGLMFAFASLYAMLRGFTDKRWLFAAGVLLGLCFAFRHDMAVYLGAAQVLGFVPAVFLRKTDERDSLIKRAIATVKIALPWVAGAAIIMLPIIAYFVINTPVSELVNQLFLFPLIEFPKVRDLPYPRLNWRSNALPFYAPFLIYALALVVALMIFVRDWKDDASYFRAWGIVMVALFGLFGFNQARVRSDTIHTVHFFLVSLTLLPVLFHGWGQKVNVAAQAIAAVAVIAGFVALIYPVDRYVEMLKDRENNKAALTPEAQANTLPRARGALVNPEQNFVVRELQRLTKPGETVYVGLERHDKVFANDVMLYFLLDRDSPTRYQELHPGLVNTEAVQREMISDLEKNRPRFVVKTDMFRWAAEPNDTAKSTGVELLDRYITKNYRYANTIGSYTLYQRREP